MEKITHQGDLYEVFLQAKPGLAYKHVGSLHAFDKELALENARDTYTRRGEGVGIWVVASKEISSISPAESNYFIDPSEDKIYRHPTFYQVPEGVTNM